MKLPTSNARQQWPDPVATAGARLWSVVSRSVGSGHRARPPEADERAGRLEDTPSRVAYSLFAGRPGMFATGGRPLPEPDNPVADPIRDFGFPYAPAATGVDTDGRLFDTTVSTVTPDANRIRYHLRFGGRSRPYSLVHRGGGTYRSEDGVLAFEWSDDERFQQLDAFLERGGAYRVVVRDVVQLYEPGGAFDWSVTRADFLDRSAGELAVSLVYLVWDEDGPENDPTAAPRGDPGVASGEPTGPDAPTFPADLTPTVDGDGLEATAMALITAGWTAEVD